MRFELKPKMFPLLAFLVPLTVRAIPEVLMGSHIVGFDPLGYYIPNVLTWSREGVSFWRLMGEAPLFYIILMPAASLGITPLILLLKILPPLLHGFLALSIYFYANNVLSWSQRKSLATTLLATLYFVVLRISWDMLRNELGLVLLFTALTLLHKSDSKTHRALTLLAMVSVVLAHPLAAVIMLMIVMSMIGCAWIEKKRAEARKLIMVSIPAILLFLLTLYARHKMPPIFPEIEVAGAQEGWLSLFGFSSYIDMSTRMLGFLIYCYLPILPLAIMGARFLKSLQIKTWVLWSLIATFYPIIFGWVYRWSLMLIFPLSFYVVEALWNMKPNPRRLRLSITLGAILAMLTVGFVVLPSESPFPYYAIPQFQIYLPSSMLQNTVPLSDCQHVVNCLNWLKDNMGENSVLLTHTAFHGWALLTINTDQVVPYGYGNPEKAAENATQQGYGEVYLIWWTDGQGWHGQSTVPTSFKDVYRSGNIAIYIYEK